MNFAKEITLTAYTVTLADLRQPKPRPQHTETIVLDGGRISALHRLGQSVAGYIEAQCNTAGYGMVSIAPAGSLAASVDLSTLWEAQTAMNELTAAQKRMAALVGQEAQA